MDNLARATGPDDETIQLRAIGIALARPRDEIEDTFVTVGARLSEGAAMLNRVTKVFEALPAELESPALTEATDRLAAMGGEAQAISALFATEQADLARLVAVVGATDRPISELRRTVKMMGIVSINARVVAAGIVGDGDDFDVFTTDIATLSASASRTIQDFTGVYQRLTSEVGQAAHQRGHFEKAHAGTLSGLSGSLADALAAVARQRQVSLDGSAQTGRVTRQVVGRIASAVMAMQGGDATRQRIEHIEAGLALLGGPGGARAAGAIGELAAAQLGAAADAFETDVTDAADTLRDLAADARTIMQFSNDIYGKGGESALAALNRQVSAAAAVLRDCEAERGKLETVAGAVQATVGILLTHVEAVQEIEANMRLVSLNAAVKCAQLGPRGTALNVIARQLRELTGETVTAAEAAMSGLHEAAELARSFVASATGEAAGKVGRLEEEARASLALLDTVDRTLASAMATLNRDGPQVIALLGSAASTFGAKADMSETMRDLQIRLVAATPPAQPERDAETNDMLTAIRKSYTMDAERQVHEHLFGRPLDTEAAPPEAPTEEAALDDIFF
jgi:hypothetical protein